MTRTAHRLLISFYSIVSAAALLGLGYLGYSYFSLPLEERYKPYPDPNTLYNLWNPSGLIGHGLGVVGTLFILIGVFSYMARKYMKALSRVGTLKYWLDFHIFMCTLGPILVLYHTTFKFGGIVSVSFWSMVVVWASGVVGRFIYIQIPRTIEGRELSLKELEDMREEMLLNLKTKYQIDEADFGRGSHAEVVRLLQAKHISATDKKQINRLITDEIRLNKRISRLAKMQSLFKYWHVAHLPFAIIMLIIMVVHVLVTVAAGAKWIF